MNLLSGFTDLDPGDKLIMDPTGSQWGHDPIIQYRHLQVVECSKGYLYTYICDALQSRRPWEPPSPSCTQCAPQTRTPRPFSRHWWHDSFLLWKWREFVRFGSANDNGKTSDPLRISTDTVWSVVLIYSETTKSGSAIYFTVPYHLFLLCFPPQPSRDLLYHTHVVHM